jgi:hypothetical protein
MARSMGVSMTKGCVLSSNACQEVYLRPVLTKFRVAAAHSCRRVQLKDENQRPRSPSLALSASIIVNYRPYVIMNNIFGHNGCIRLNKSKNQGG